MTFESYKSRFRILLIVSIIMSYFVYTLSIRKTIEIRKEIKDLQNGIIRLDDAPILINKYDNQIKYLDSLIGNSLAYVSDPQSNLLKLVSDYCIRYGDFLQEIPETIIYDQDDYTKYISIIRITGEYNQLLKLLNDLEKNRTTGKILSVDFTVHFSRKNRKRYLRMTLYIEYLTKKV